MICLVSKKAGKRILAIYQHEGGVFSVYLKDSEDAVWLNDKVELYRYLKELGGK